MRIILNLSLLIIISLQVSCDLGAPSYPEVAEKNQAIRLGLAMQPTSALLIIAEKQGFFLQQGINVQITKFPSGKRALHEGLLQKEVDIISLNESPFVMAAFEHDDLRTFAGIFVDDNTNSIVSRRDIGVQFPADLRGKRIATQKASAVHYFMHQFLIENGIGFDQVNISFYKAEELVGKLLKGKIDAFSMREPYVSQAVKFLQDNAVVFEEEGIYTQVGLLVASDAYIYKNKALIKKFLLALKQAEIFFEKDREASLKTVAAYLGIDFTAFSQSFGQTEVRLSIDQLYINVSEDIARWAVFKGYVNKKDMPNFLQKVVTEPLREILPDAVTLVDGRS